MLFEERFLQLIQSLETTQLIAAQRIGYYPMGNGEASPSKELKQAGQLLGPANFLQFEYGPNMALSEIED